jgi:hypothetical protein
MGSFNRAVFEQIKTVFPSAARFFYGSPNGPGRPFYVMLPTVEDDQQPVSLCETQGAQGVARFQFSVASGGSAGKAEDLLENLAEVVRDIEGRISYTDTDGTHSFDIWNNVTGGVRAIGGADLNTWDAIFETEFWWKKTS